MHLFYQNYFSVSVLMKNPLFVDLSRPVYTYECLLCLCLCFYCSLDLKDIQSLAILPSTFNILNPYIMYGTNLFVWLSACLSVCLFAFLFTYVLTCLFAWLSTCLSLCLSICLYVCCLFQSLSLSQPFPFPLLLPAPWQLLFHRKLFFLGSIFCPPKRHLKRWKSFGKPFLAGCQFPRCVREVNVKSIFWQHPFSETRPIATKMSYIQMSSAFKFIPATSWCPLRACFQLMEVAKYTHLSL